MRPRRLFFSFLTHARLSPADSSAPQTAPSVSGGGNGISPRISRLSPEHSQTFPVEIASALAAAHGQRGERVLEDLFERQEFQDAEVHRGMEAQSALVGADGAVHLDAEAAIDLHFTRVIEPGHAEHKDSFGLRDTFQNLGFAILGVAFQHGPQGLEHFEDSLVEFRRGWVFGFDAVENLIGIVRHSVKLGRFHDMTHRLASEFYVMNAYVMNGLSKHWAPQ